MAPFFMEVVLQDSSDVIYSKAKNTLKFTGFWSVILSIPWFFIPKIIEENSGSEPMVWILLIFPLAHFLVLYGFFINWRLWNHYGAMPLCLDPSPGSVGGDVGGVIECRHLLSGPVDVLLTCIHSTTDRSGEDVTTSEKAEWQVDGVARINSTGQGCLISFRFTNIPSYLPSSSEEQGDNYYYWSLQILANEEIKLDRVYEIPVQDDVQTSQALNFESNSPQELKNTQKGIKELLPFISDNLYVYGYFSNFVNGLTWLVVGGICFAVAAGVLVFLDEIITYVFGMFFGLFGVAFTVYGVYRLFNKITVSIHPEGISTQKEVLGFSVLDAEVAYSNIRSIEVASNESGGGEGRHTKYYTVKAYLIQGDVSSITLAEYLTKRTDADFVKSYFESLMK